jgi:hypothetical protein
MGICCEGSVAFHGVLSWDAATVLWVSGGGGAVGGVWSGGFVSGGSKQRQA